MARDLTFKLILDSLGFQRGAKAAGDALSKLGKDAKQVSGDMKPLADGMDWLGGLAAKLSSPVGIATTAVAALGTVAVVTAKSVAALAQQAEDLQKAASKTGIGLDALQRYQRTAQNLGMSLDTVTGAVNKMQKGLETNSKALTEAGLRLEHIRGLRPEEQFQELSTQIAAMSDPAQRTAAAIAAFGKAGAEALPFVLKLGTDGTDAIVTMSDSQIKALAKIDDALDDTSGAWTDFKNQLTIVASEAGGTSFLETMTGQLRGFAAILRDDGFLKALGMLAQVMSGNIGAMAQVGIAGAVGSRGPTPQSAQFVRSLTSGIGAIPGLSFTQPPSTEPFRMEGLLSPAQVAGREMARKADEAYAKKILDLTKDYNKALRDIVSGPAQGLSDIYSDLDEQSRNILEASNKTSAALLAGLKGTRLRGGDMLPKVGGLGLWTRYQDVLDQEMENAAESTKKITTETIDWSATLNDLANQLSILSGVSDGAVADLAKLAMAISSAIAVGQQMQSNWATGTKAGKALAIGQGVATLGSIYGNATTSYKSSAVSGMAQGAAAGSSFGVPGAIVGGIIGGIAGLFGAAKKNKELKQVAGVVGQSLAKQMAEQFAEQAKAEGKTIKQVAKEWLEVQRKEFRTQGMAQARSGVEGLMAVLGTSPEITAIAAKNFATLFFETVKDEGWVAAASAFSDIFAKLKEHFGDNIPASLQGIAKLMSLASNPAVAPFLQAAQAQAQFVTGAMNAGFASVGMQGDSAVIARQTLENLKANGATDAEGYQAIAALLQSNVNAAIASGQGISSELQALLDEARANGIDIVADINVQQLDVLRAIYKQLGGTSSTVGTGAGVTNGGGRTDDGLPTYASGGVGDFGSGRLAMLHGREAIVPLDSDWRPRGGGGGGSVQITQQPVFNLNPLQSRADQRRLVEVIIAEWQRANRNDPYSRRVARTTANGGR